MNMNVASLSEVNPLAEAIPSGIASGFIDDIRSTLYDWHSRSLATVLVTLVNYEGSSPRPVGSQMVVNESGEAVGLISGGCLESALIEEALSCLRLKQQRLVRYGKSSDYFDIQLPCGSGIDVLITPNPEASFINQLFAAYSNRTLLEWTADLVGGSHQVVQLSNEQLTRVTTKNYQYNRAQVENDLSNFTKTYTPRTRVVVVGEGAIYDYFVAMAQLFDIEMLTCSTGRYSTFNAELLDPWSALVTLSHSHEWEPDILSKAVETDAFYIGALGSRSTHSMRCELLRERGISDTQINRIKGPAGLNLGGRTPPEIALSILAEIVCVRQQAMPKVWSL
ncbi:MAG: XdhC family protein [Pseudomonadales bacterium]|nr:XdhC family protein [Pseudomonadales bacterium]